MSRILMVKGLFLEIFIHRKQLLIPRMKKLDRLQIQNMYMYLFAAHAQISSFPLLKYLFLSVIDNQHNPFRTYLP